MANGPEGKPQQGVAADNPTQKINWDDSKMTTTFANVVNGASTREEVTLFFGTNQSWNVADDGEVRIQLSDRIILTPYAAKRLLVLMSHLIKQYEDRFGVLDIGLAGPTRQQPQAKPSTTAAPPSSSVQ